MEQNMAYRYGDRSQMALFPQSIEEYIPADAPVRAYDAFVEALDFYELGIPLDPHEVGNSKYYPKTMLKLLVYGYSYGLKSSRKLERETHYNLSFIWLMGGMKPDHKTISEFRRNNKKALKKVLKQCARLCLELNLIEGNVLFIDGTKIRANAATGKTREKAWYKKKLIELDQRIEELLNDCEIIDHQEQHLGSFVSMNKELSKTEKLKSKVQKVLEQFKKTDGKKINQTDPDCKIMRSIHGSHASYNVQSVVDDKNGLIVQAEAVSDENDLGQFARQTEQANEILKEPCTIACADNGYADTNELEKIDAQDIKVIVPSRRQALHEGETPFNKSKFTYNKEKDCYYCPKGHRLRFTGTEKETGNKRYLIVDKHLCHNCRHFGNCTKGKFGRRIVRLHNEEIKEKLEFQYEETFSQKIYARRKDYVEHPFGHIKRNLKTDAFMLRGRHGVQAETSLLASCFNIARMITIMGVPGLIEKLSRTVVYA
jgi:transposase